MNPVASRNPTLIDGMILIAAMAVGFAGMRAENSEHYHPTSAYVLFVPNKDSLTILGWGGPSPSWHDSAYEIASITEQAAPLVAGLTLAMLMIRLRRPRPSLARLSRQPGFVAEGTVVAMLSANLLLGLVQVATAAAGVSSMADPRFYANASFLTCRAIRVGPIGWGVVASWALLAMTRRWRHEPGWIDFAGIGIGLAWIGLLAVDWYINDY